MPPNKQRSPETNGQLRRQTRVQNVPQQPVALPRNDARQGRYRTRARRNQQRDHPEPEERAERDHQRPALLRVLGLGRVV